ncbi:MAG TPA: hypothetical protein VIY56_00655, partial [Vicinamibacterales bacterium]
MIHFDFDDRYQDETVVGHAISRREGVMLSVITHALVIALILFGGRLALFQPSPEELARRQEQLEEQERARRARFVFVEPRVDTPAPPRLRPELSDQDRRAAAPEVAPTPANPQPLSRGNSAELTEAAEAAVARGPEAPPQPEAPTPPAEEAPRLPESDRGLRRPVPEPPRAATGALGEALRNLQKYVQNQTFNNPQGGATDPGTSIQFDTKGVEFGPWIRRFVSQVRRNWFVPMAAMTMRGRVVITFYVHRNGALTDVTVVRPS